LPGDVFLGSAPVRLLRFAEAPPAPVSVRALPPAGRGESPARRPDARAAPGPCPASRAEPRRPRPSEPRLRPGGGPAVPRPGGFVTVSPAPRCRRSAVTGHGAPWPVRAPCPGPRAGGTPSPGTTVPGTPTTPAAPAAAASA